MPPTFIRLRRFITYNDTNRHAKSVSADDPRHACVRRRRRAALLALARNRADQLFSHDGASLCVRQSPPRSRLATTPKGDEQGFFACPALSTKPSEVATSRCSSARYDSDGDSRQIMSAGLSLAIKSRSSSQAIACRRITLGLAVKE